ncbi:aspartyl/glutamyl-tRNA(Asn/Gln) amidotransferase subunit C [Pilibacter termitis]|uniref:Aspartyl/glutamyl-tRNA(Asn/Gln) amidotransferase subunit C n=1 Tax=Pilibacter termitis TaxID=263852 RepID=A0A1T4L5V4_9ENTE|nr:Asp-tRNA(Asn)/Glu-tRNA(Gln) amidotransferase subunit GatC [Pilibacter termitis]SJZ49921.1 aspartyl/glutamyl-tRNA(Asn/Gln) amidotransferase subunit C [Pilibacter termitis]
MQITEKDVKHVANLSKLDFPQEELHAFTETFGKIIHMIETLEEVDTTGVAFTSNVVDAINVLREDKATKGTSRDELMKNVPEKQDGFIKVPAILDDGSEGA